jgi:hypothetical protein
MLRRVSGGAVIPGPAEGRPEDNSVTEGAWMWRAPSTILRMVPLPRCAVEDYPLNLNPNRITRGSS